MALNGIDISGWQDGIDLSSVPADFVIIKATQGVGFVSGSCDTQVQGAKKARKLWGFYHYAGGNDATEEANYFYDNTKNYFGYGIPCLDWESAENGNWGNNDAGWVKTFCDRIYELTGVHPIVYIQASALNRLEGKIGDCGMWVAQYANNEPTGYQDEPWNEGAYVCAIRQYSSNGYIDGYSGRLDLDKFYGDADAWMKYANPSGDTPVEPTPEPAPEPTPVPEPSSGFAVGDIVVPTAGVDYNGTPVMSYHGQYTIKELNGDRAVLSVDSVVWAAMNTANIRKVCSASEPTASLQVGDSVRIENGATDLNTGTTYADFVYNNTYTVIEIDGDRVVFGVNGAVTGATNISNIIRV